MSPDRVPLAGKRRAQAPPPWVVWEALSDPFASPDRPWFDVQPDEQPPAVLAQARPSLVAWGSIWPDQPDLAIEFRIEPAGAGSMLNWTLLGPEGVLDPADIGRRRYRLQQLINGQLRETFG
jgi:hypothetical protein